MSQVEIDHSDGLSRLDSAFLSRVRPLIDAMALPASVVLLIGETGTGKRYLAEQVTRLLENGTDGEVVSIHFPDPAGVSAEPEEVFGAILPEVFLAADLETSDWMSDTFRAARVAERLVESARRMSGSREPLFLLPGVDRYSPRSTAVLEHLIRQRGVRIIATAYRMTAGAGQMGRDPRVNRIAVGPLDLQEAEALTSTMLGTVRLTPATLRRWHLVTGGNSQALTLMLLANVRSGALHQRQGVARVMPGHDEIPEELINYLEETCSPEERAALELIALAEPLVEPALIRLLDPDVTNTLLDRDLISTSVVDGRSLLHIGRPIVAEALRARMSPTRRIWLAELFFRALTAGDMRDDFASSSPHLLRAVAFGLESGRQLPHDWLAGAISLARPETDPKLMLRISLALAADHATEDAAAAAIRAVSYATQIGDAAAVATAHRRIDEMLADTAAAAALPVALRTGLQLAQIERYYRLGESMAQTLHRLDAIERALGAESLGARIAVEGLRLQLLLRSGEFAAANAALAAWEGSDNLVVEWVRAPARAASALLLYQQGRLQEGLQTAHRARSIGNVGARPLNDTAELQAFQWFLGYWASGSADGARRALEELEEIVASNRYAGAPLFSDMTEAGWALLALLEARWRDAADLVELVLESHTAYDPHGLLPLLHAVHALALAALGDRDEAVEALQRAKEESRGVSQAFAGFRKRILVSAQQWLRIGDPAAEALELADWAEEQGLALVELEALHIAAVESGALGRKVQERARELVDSVDPLIAEVIIAHIEKIARGASPSDASEPEVRLLADLGLWIPLPKSPGLTAREREIALLASLGYSSRSIAERFTLSERTVETHLAHVYTKLGITDRVELRRWFSVDRRTA